MTETAAEQTLVLFVYVGLALTITFRPLRRDHPPDPAGSTRYWMGSDMEMRLLGLLAGITLVVIPVVDAALPWLEFADSRFRTILAWLGVGLAAGALWVFWRSAHDLVRFARRGRDAPFAFGIYRFVRHPLYTALLMWVLAHCALSQNWLSALLAALTFLALYGLRVPREEQSLLEQFGHRYLEYMERTGALLPRFTALRR